MPSLQVSVPGQAVTSTIVPAPGRARPIGLQLRVERRQVGLAHPAQDDVLLDRGADGVADVAARDVAPARRIWSDGDVAERQRDGGHGVAGLPLAVDVGVRATPRSPRAAAAPLSGTAGARAASRRSASTSWQVRRSSASSCGQDRRAPRRTRRRNSSMPSFATRNLMRARLRLFFSPRRAKTRAIACDRRQQLLHRAGPRRAAWPGAARCPGRRRRRGRSRGALAVHDLARRWRRSRACITRPQASPAQPEKAILNLRPKSWQSGWPSRKRNERLRVGRDVEGLGAADAGDRAGGDVAHAVAAGLARGDADGGQAAHEVGRVFDVDVVELDVLARGDVQDAVGVFLGQLGQHVELLGRDAAEGDLDALHARRVPERLGALGELAGRDTRASVLAMPSWRWPLS